MTPSESFARFATVVNARAPFGYAVDLHELDVTRRAICGDCGRVNPTRQNLCPHCGGFVFAAEEIDAMREIARRGELKSQPAHAVQAAAAEFVASVLTDR